MKNNNYQSGDGIKRVATFLLWFICSSGASSHHSHGEYNFEVTEEYVGDIVEISWRNPHVRILLRSTQDDGTEVLWDLELFPASRLGRLGLNQEMVELGETVRVAGHRSRSRDKIYLTNMLLSDGTEIRTRGGIEPRWSETNIGFIPGYTAFPLNQDLFADDDFENIFRVWLPSENTRTSEYINLPLTDSARAVKTSWNSVTDTPQNGCEPIGMPEAMFGPNPIEFVRDGENITLRLEEFDNVRTIYMTANTSLHNQQATIMGYSVGHWEENTLVVRTTNIDYPWMDYEGTPQTEAAIITERFMLSLDERTLNWEATVTDPNTFTEPVLAFAARYDWAPQEKIQAWDCLVL